jgi:phage/conjugal plasmid C-4 type zinc finger TraR family protein
VTDVVDRASEREEELRQDALDEQARRDHARGLTYMDSARNCRICDEPIAEGRRRAVPGVQTCFDCQTDLEHALVSGHGD